MLHVPASRPRLRSAPLLLLVAICLVATGCGGDSTKGKLLSQQQAGELRGTLSQVEEDVAAKNCTGATERVAALQQQVDTIKRLNRDLRSSLRASVRRLDTLVSDTCQTTAPTETTPTTPDTGTSGTTGTTGAEGNKEKKPKKEKPKKAGTPPGLDGQTPPGQQNGGGGAGVPGESHSNGNGGN